MSKLIQSFGIKSTGRMASDDTESLLPTKEPEEGPSKNEGLKKSEKTLCGINYTLQWDVMFPTKIAFTMWIVYVFLCNNAALMQYWTRNAKGKYDYNPAVVVILIEVVKLVASACMAVRQSGFSATYAVLYKNWWLIVLYCVPSGLYAAYNNLSYVNMRNYTPAAYSLFIQLKMLILGLCYQVMFRRRLSTVQWSSLFVLTFAIVLKQVDFGGLGAMSLYEMLQLDKFIFIIFQLVSSCMANVYNEYLLNKHKDKMDFYCHNIANYANGVNINIVILMIFNSSDIQTEFVTSIAALKLPHMLLIINQSVLGLCSAFLLRYLNSIVKAMNTPVVLVMQAIIGYIAFGIQIVGWTNYLAYALGILSIYIYALNPIESKY